MFSYYLSCPFKIGYFNLGVFLLPLTKTELRSFGWRREHLWKPRAFHSILAVLFYFPHFIFYIHAWRPSGAPAVLSARTRSGSPARPFVICRDDMNLWMQRPPQLDYCRKHLAPAAGFLQIPPKQRAEGGRVEIRSRALQPRAKVWINKRWWCDCDTFQNNASEMLDAPPLFCRDTRVSVLQHHQITHNFLTNGRRSAGRGTTCRRWW